MDVADIPSMLVANEFEYYGERRVHLFRTYDMDLPNGFLNFRFHNCGRADNCFIWEVARATSAAPQYFKSIKIDEKNYDDGGFGWNNPAEIALDEVNMKEKYERSKRPGDSCASEFPLEVLISIGTGKTKTRAQRAQTRWPRLTAPNMVRKILWHVDNGMKFITDVERVDGRVEKALDEKSKQYFRWDGPEEVGRLKLDEWKPARRSRLSTKNFIEEEINRYLKQKDNEERLRRCAKALVELRRGRAEDEERWRRFTECTYYACTACSSVQSFSLPRELRAHICGQHQQGVSNIEEEIQKGETYPKVAGGPW